MASSPQVRIKIALDLPPPGPSAETVWADPCPEPGTYRLDNAPSFTDDYGYGDVVRAVPSPDGWLMVSILVQPSQWRHFRLIFPVTARESDLERLLNAVRKRHGAAWGDTFWEGGLGMAMLEVPPGVEPGPLLESVRVLSRERLEGQVEIDEVRPGADARPGQAPTGLAEMA